MIGSSTRGVVLSLLLLALGVSLASCGGSGSPGAGNEQKEVEERQLIEEATLSGIRSGWMEGRFTLDNETKEEAVQWRASTPFVGLGKRHGPELNARYEASGPYDGEITEEAGRVLALAARTSWRHDGVEHGLKGPLFDAEDAGCEQALKSIQVGDLITHLSSKRIPTSEAILVKAKLDLPALLSTFDTLLQNSACGGLLREAGVSLDALKALEAEVKSTFEKSEASFEIREDHVLLSVAFGIWVKSPSPGAEEVDGRMEITLSRFNEVKKVSGRSAAWAGARSEALSGPQQRSLKAGAALIHALLSSLDPPPESRGDKSGQ